MLTLTYGYKLPETNDKGPVVFPALEADIQQLNDHNHDGANSTKLTPSSLTAVTQVLAAATWGSDLGGSNYEQTFTMLPGYDYDTVTLTFRKANGDYFYPSVTKVTASSVKITTNEKADIQVIYGV